MPRGPLVHGTLTGYTYHRCRCEDCRKARRDWQRRDRAFKRGVLPPPPPPPAPESLDAGDAALARVILEAKVDQLEAEPWRRRAACRGLTHLMFDPRMWKRATEVCRSCPVRAECAAFAAGQKDRMVGCWAGDTGRRLGIRARHAAA